VSSAARKERSLYPRVEGRAKRSPRNEHRSVELWLQAGDTHPSEPPSGSNPSSPCRRNSRAWHGSKRSPAGSSRFPSYRPARAPRLRAGGRSRQDWPGGALKLIICLLLSCRTGPRGRFHSGCMPSHQRKRPFPSRKMALRCVVRSAVVVKLLCARSGHFVACDRGYGLFEKHGSSRWSAQSLSSDQREDHANR